MRTLLLAGAAVAALGLGTAVLVPGAAAQDGQRYAAVGDGGLRGAHAAFKRGPRGDRRRVRGFFRLAETFDSDGDGRITQDEIDGVRSERLTTFDTNSDGALSLEEYEALWLDAMRERLVRQFQDHDRDGDGIVTAEEFQHRTANMVAIRDRNRDGALSLEDARPRRERNGRGPRRDAE
ncbi:MAG: hypothetical protein AAGG47_17355 [Pseudomonadota bacterium]